MVLCSWQVDDAPVKLAGVPSVSAVLAHLQLEAVVGFARGAVAVMRICTEMNNVTAPSRSIEGGRGRPGDLSRLRFGGCAHTMERAPGVTGGLAEFARAGRESGGYTPTGHRSTDREPDSKPSTRGAQATCRRPSTADDNSGSREVTCPCLIGHGQVHLELSLPSLHRRARGCGARDPLRPGRDTVPSPKSQDQVPSPQRSWHR